MDTNLSPAMATQLRRFARSARPLSSRTMHTGTRIALERRGLIRMDDRFPSGSSVWTITNKGREAIA